MNGSADLYAVATLAEREAQPLQHQPDAHGPGCAPWCRKCRIEAKARLYGRAGDTAKALEDRP